MRIPGTMICLMVLCAAATALAQKQRPTPEEEEEAAKFALVEAAAKEAFAAADHNHNDILSKTEFPDAERLLEEALLRLVSQGVLGQAPTGGIANQTLKLAAQQTAARKAASAAPDLSRKKSISPSEFQLFARRIAAQADAEFAQNRVAYAAYMQQMKQAYQQQLYSRYRVRSGTPIFIGP